jgi:hypothetical protein
MHVMPHVLQDVRSNIASGSMSDEASIECLFLFRWEDTFLINYRLFWHAQCNIVFLSTLHSCTNKAAADCFYLSPHLTLIEGYISSHHSPLLDS